MNHKVLVLLSLSLLVSAELMSAPRRQIRAKEAQNGTEQPQVLMVPVAVSHKPATSAKEQQERDFFLALLSVAANFGNVLLHRDDKEAAVQGVSNMINGIVHAAEIITKCRKRGMTNHELDEIIAQIITKHATVAAPDHV